MAKLTRITEQRLQGRKDANSARAAQTISSQTARRQTRSSRPIQPTEDAVDSGSTVSSASPPTPPFDAPREQHTSINYNDELFRGAATSGFDDGTADSLTALETPTEKRRRLLGTSAANAVNASRQRHEAETAAREARRMAKAASASAPQIKQERPEDNNGIIVIDSSSDEEPDDVAPQMTASVKEEQPSASGSGSKQDSVSRLHTPEPRQVQEPASAVARLRTPPAIRPDDPYPEASAQAEEEVEKEPIARDFPWPEHFVELEKTFKALNTVYAFCSGRKHMATTYDTLKTSVQGLLKRPLEIIDIAQIKSLCPDLVNFAYIEQELLNLHDEGPSSLGWNRKKDVEHMSKYQQMQHYRREVDDAYAQAAADIRAFGDDAPKDSFGAPAQGTGWQDDIAPSQTNSQHPSAGLLPAMDLRRTPPPSRDIEEEFVLFFSFNDGTLKGPKATRRGRPGMRRGPNRKDPTPQANPGLNEMPSAAAMKKLIDKRNYKFEQAVLELLNACKKKEEDPVQLIIAAADDHVPVNPELGTKPTGETPKKRKMRLEYFMNNPDQRPDIVQVIEEFKEQLWYKGQIVAAGHRTIPARSARYEDLSFLLSQEIVNALWATRKIEEFYLHQADALSALDEGKNIIVCTSTSSGKSLIYQIPVLRALQEDYESTAMYIFPTKALAQDQRRTLQDLLMNCDGLEETIVSTYDGDTPKDLRSDIRERASVIFTNPDMLHQSVLPNENQWRRFLRGLRYVVVDELHMYNGLFGAHVSFIMRRLRRICHALGNDRIRFVSCSATVANPADHMKTLFGVEEVEVITEDGSPAGSKEWLIWNPPLIDINDPKQGRVSAYAEVSKVFRHLVERGVRTIIFTKVRRTCEIVMNQIRNDLLLDNRQDIIGRVMSYRSGYSPEDRRKIEQDMFKGQLLGIVATSALELGIDIGTLDAVIMLGFPYSISSLRQQAGRAGRRQKDSLAVLVGDPFPMDQHYMRNPEEIFTQPDTVLSVDLTNDFVLESHLQCAAAEMPIQPSEDAKYFGDEGVIRSLCETRLEIDQESYYQCRAELRPNPAREVPIRGARQVTYLYVDDSPGRRTGPRIMEEVEVVRAIFEAFEGAIFMHQGLTYICKDIDHEKRIARMVQSNVNYHTRPRDHTDTDAVETHRIRSLRGTTSRAYYGHVRIASHIWGYFKVDRRANILDEVSIECPPFVRDTKGLWIDVPSWLVNALTDKTINAAAAIHAAEHALLSLTPMFVVSLAGDVRTECKVAEREYARKATSRKRPARLIFYDMPGQNSGVCNKAFEHLDGLIRIAVSVIESCTCVDGCPSCVTSQTCAHANLVTSKIGALGVLRGLVGLEPFDPDLPQQNEPGHAEGHLDSTQSVGHTIAEAAPVRTVNGADIPVEDHEERLPPSLQALLNRNRMRQPSGQQSSLDSLSDEENASIPDDAPSGTAWQRQNQLHRQAYAAPPVGKSLHYEEEEAT